MQHRGLSNWESEWLAGAAEVGVIYLREFKQDDVAGNRRGRGCHLITNSKISPPRGRRSERG